MFIPVKDYYLSSDITAEGFRKVGILQQLLANEVLVPGASGPLFWDEPESNLNPKLMRMLVEILLQFSRNSQQIIIATHDYVLLKWFDLLAKTAQDDHVRFHALSHDSSSGAVNVNTTDDFLGISPNVIADTFSTLYDAEICRIAGE